MEFEVLIAQILKVFEAMQILISGIQEQKLSSLEILLPGELELIMRTRLAH